MHMSSTSTLDLNQLRVVHNQRSGGETWPSVRPSLLVHPKSRVRFLRSPFYEYRLLRSCHIKHDALECVSASFTVTCIKRLSLWARQRELSKGCTFEARHKACFHCTLAALIHVHSLPHKEVFHCWQEAFTQTVLLCIMGTFTVGRQELNELQTVHNHRSGGETWPPVRASLLVHTMFC